MVAENGKKVSFEKEIKIYENAIREQLKELKAVMEEQTKAMNKLAVVLSVQHGYAVLASPLEQIHLSKEFSGLNSQLKC